MIGDTDNSHSHDPASQDEMLLREHLASRLDPHLGQARRHFEQVLAAEPEPAPLRLHQPADRSVSWRIGFGLVAAAAGIALAVGVWVMIEAGKPVPPVANGENGNSLQGVSYSPLEYSESWQDEDIGVYQFQGRPVRAVHQQQWERARYRDAGYDVEIELPRSQLVLVDAPVQ